MVALGTRAPKGLPGGSQERLRRGAPDRGLVGGRGSPAGGSKACPWGTAAVTVAALSGGEADTGPSADPRLPSLGGSGAQTDGLAPGSSGCWSVSWRVEF